MRGLDRQGDFDSWKQRKKREKFTQKLSKSIGHASSIKRQNIQINIWNRHHMKMRMRMVALFEFFIVFNIRFAVSIQKLLNCHFVFNIADGLTYYKR